MRNQNKKSQLLKIIIFTLAAAVLSACNVDLVGVAGESTTTETETVVSPETTETAIETPSSTPFPAATGHIVFISNREGPANLYMTSPDGVEVVRLTSNLSEDSAPRISPDGTRVAFVSTVNNNADIYIFDLTSNIITRVTDAPEKDSAPTWSPNGQRLAFESFRDGNFEIYVANADGSNQTRLTFDASGDSHPVWSPVANEIVFVSGRFGNSDLMLVDLNGAVATLTTSPTPDNAPTWSPNGSFIAFQTFTEGLSNLCIIGRDALNQRCVTTTPSSYEAPVWSPDGNWIASSFGQESIHLFNIVDGSTHQLSAPGIAPSGVPVWSPDGLRLVFQAQTNGDTELFSALIPTNEFIQITNAAGFDGEPVWNIR